MIKITRFSFYNFIFVFSIFYPCTVQGDVTGAPCSLGSWLPWNCSCCGNSLVITVYRARAKCCGGTAECGSLRVAAIMSSGGDKYIQDGNCMAKCPKEYKGYNRHTCTSKAINLNGITQSDKTQSCKSTCIAVDKPSTKATEFTRQSTSTLASTTSVSATPSTVILSTTSAKSSNTTKYSPTNKPTSSNFPTSSLPKTSNNNSQISSLSSGRPPNTTSEALLATSSVLPTDETSSLNNFNTQEIKSGNEQNFRSNSSMSSRPPNVSTEVFSTDSSVLPTADATLSLSNFSTEVGTSGSARISVGAISGIVCGFLMFLAVLVSIIILLKKKELKSAVEPDRNTGDAELKQMDFSYYIANKEMPTEIDHNQTDKHKRDLYYSPAEAKIITSRCEDDFLPL